MHCPNELHLKAAKELSSIPKEQSTMELSFIEVKI